MTSTDLNSNQIAAIHRTRTLGERISSDNPEIVQMYREGKSYSDIAEVITGSYLGYSFREVRAGVGYAIREVLLEEDEKEVLERKHKVMGGSKTADLLSRGGRSINIIFSSGELSCFGHVGGHESAISRGYVPWTDRKCLRYKTILGEKDVALMLYNSPDFKRTKNPRKGCVDLRRVSDKINILFHKGEPVRSPSSVDGTLRAFKS